MFGYLQYGTLAERLHQCLPAGREETEHRRRRCARLRPHMVVGLVAMDHVAVEQRLGRCCRRCCGRRWRRAGRHGPGCGQRLRLADVGGLQIHLAKGVRSRHGQRVLQSWRSAARSIQHGQLVQLLGQVVLGRAGGRWWRRRWWRTMHQTVIVVDMAMVVMMMLVLMLMVMLMLVLMASGQLRLQGVLLLEELALLLEQAVLQELLLQRRLLHRRHGQLLLVLLVVRMRMWVDARRRWRRRLIAAMAMGRKQLAAGVQEQRRRRRRRRQWRIGQLLVVLRLQVVQRVVRFDGHRIELTVWQLTIGQAQLLEAQMAMTVTKTKTMSMTMALAKGMAMQMGVAGRIDSRLLLQLLYLQPAVALGLLVAIAAIDTTRAQQGAGAEEALGHQAVAGAAALTEMDG